MGRLRTFVLSVGALAAMGAGANAADAPQFPSLPPPRDSGRPLPVEEFVSGWYLRGDIGYRFAHAGTSSSLDNTQVPDVVSGKLDNAIVGGLGGGYKWDWFRIDLTGDYGSRARYRATTASSTFSASVDSFTVMVNGYIDLGTWAGFTPYIGGGLGAANLNTYSYDNPSAIAPMPSTAMPSSRWNLAWAAMGGLSYTVTHNLLLDLGYRHIDMGEARGGPNKDLRVKSLTGDEVRIGFRYMID